MHLAINLVFLNEATSSSSSSSWLISFRILRVGNIEKKEESSKRRREIVSEKEKVGFQNNKNVLKQSQNLHRK